MGNPNAARADPGAGVSARADGNTAEHTPVVLDGLRAKPALNGLNATVMKYDRATARYTVMVEDGSLMAARPCNLIVTDVAPEPCEGYEEDDAPSDGEVEEIFTPGAAAAPQAVQHETPTAAGGWRPAGPARPANDAPMPSFLRERLAEAQAGMAVLDGLGSSSEDEDEAGPRIDDSLYDRHTLTLVKVDRLGMRIADSDLRLARVEAVSEGPARAAGVREGDFILAVGGCEVGCRAEATARIRSAVGLLTMQVARRKDSPGRAPKQPPDRSDWDPD